MRGSFLPLGLCLCCTGWAAAGEFVYSFKGRGYDTALFRPTGNIARTTHSEARGLRITMTPEHTSKLPVGVIPRTGVRGDFEITMTFEVLRLDKPTDGSNRPGVGIYVTFVSPTQKAASLGRVIQPDGKHAFVCHRASTPLGGQREHHGKTTLTEASSGRLRLVRKGAMVSYQVAEGDSSNFRELDEVEMGTEDLDLVRFAADNQGSAAVVDVRINKVSIVADDLGAVAPLPRPRRSTTLWWAAGLAVFLLAAAGFWQRKKLNAAMQKTAALVGRKIAKRPARPESPTPPAKQPLKKTSSP